MTTTYVSKKSELTQQMNDESAKGLKVFRTRGLCQCAYPGNRRNAVLCVKGSEIKSAIIKCKQCAKREEVRV